MSKKEPKCPICNDTGYDRRKHYEFMGPDECSCPIGRKIVADGVAYWDRITSENGGRTPN